MSKLVEIVKPEKGSYLELLPCPFCGNNEIVYVSYDTTMGLRWRVNCSKCIAGIDNGRSQTKDQVRDKWNRRTAVEN